MDLLNSLLSVQLHLPDALLTSPALWSSVTLLNTLVSIIAVFIWTTNRQTQINKSKSQQKRSKAEDDNEDKLGDVAFQKSIDEDNELYFNDFSRSEMRLSLIHAMSADADSDDDLEASDDENDDDPEIGSDPDEVGVGKTNGKVSKILRSSTTQWKAQRAMQHDLLKSISKLKVFSYLSDEAFLQSLSLMEYIDLPNEGMDLFTGDRAFDGSLYVLIEGKMDVSCGLQSAEQPIHLSAGKGDLVTSFLSAFFGLIEENKKVKGETTGLSSINIHTVQVKATSTEKNTRLIRIPPSAFLSMLESYPHDVHQIAQTVFARCQRVTISTLIKNLGLGFEMLYNHGNQLPINGAGTDNVPTSEDGAMKMIAKEIFEDSTTNLGDNSTCTINVKHDISKKIASIVSKSLGSTSSSVHNTIEKEASVVMVKPGEVILHAETKSEYVYYVIDGAIEVGANREQEKGIKSTSYRDDEVDDPFRILYSVGPGDSVGQMSCFSDEVSFVTLRSAANIQIPTMLLQLPKEIFRSLVDKNSQILIQCINKILSVDFSPLVHLLDWGVEWLHVQAGTLLANKGEICDKLHVVLSGRLKGESKMSGNYKRSAKNDDEYGRGSCIGETRVILGEKWTSDVYAIRNSELAVLPAKVLEYIMHMFPHTAVHFAKEIASRQVKNNRTYRKATQSFSGLAHHELSVATLAVVPLCFDSVKQATELCDQITGALGKIEPCALMTKAIARKSVGSKVFNLRNAVHELKMSRLMGDLEESHALTVYQTENRFTWWTKLCVQRADCVLLVVDAASAPACEHVERYLVWAFSKLLVRHVQVLVLQQVEEKASNNANDSAIEKRVPICQELSDWIETTNFIEGQHLVRKPIKIYEKDVARMCRRITGRSLGLALGGGGARGLAHLGVIRALMEKGVSVDICGGTSQGAFVGALYAKNPDSFSELMESSRIMSEALCSKSEKLRDLTLPIVSYFNGNRFNKGIIDCIGEKTKINELILNYFCTSTDLCRSGQVIHTKGACWKYVRASMSLHGYFPPIAENGQLLVDGGYTNLVPGDIMINQMNANAVICVDVSKEDTDGYYEYGTSLSGFWLMVNSLNPFTKTVRVPSMGDLSQKLIWVSSKIHRSEVMNNADLFLTPPVSHYGTLDFDKMDEIVELGYEYAKPRIDAFIKENPWVVS